MQQTIDVFVLGMDRVDASVPGEWESRLSFRLHPTGTRSVAQFVQVPIFQQVMQGDADFSALVFDTRPETLQGISRSAWLMAESSELHQAKESMRHAEVAHLAVERIDPCLFAEFLARPGLEGIAALLSPRARHGAVVFRREAFRHVGPLRPVTEPIWDWVLRAARAGKFVMTSPLTNHSNSSESRLPLLVPPRPGNELNWLLEHLVSISPKELGRGQLLRVDEIARRAGLLQWHDFLDQSHELSQSIEGEGENLLGDYWHAIMHRREPDFSNAKYWFRRIGNQPTFLDLRQHADAVLSECSDPQAATWRDKLQVRSKWNPLAFVDLCEACAADETSELAIAARRIQYAEMCLLM